MARRLELKNPLLLSLLVFMFRSLRDLNHKSFKSKDNSCKFMLSYMFGSLPVQIHVLRHLQMRITLNKTSEQRKCRCKKVITSSGSYYHLDFLAFWFSPFAASDSRDFETDPPRKLLSLEPETR